MFDTKEDVQRVNESALARAGARQLPLRSEIDLFPVGTEEDPLLPSAVLSPEPRSDVIVKYFGITTISNGFENLRQTFDDSRKLLEVRSNSLEGSRVTYERFVETFSHQREGLDAGKFNIC